MTNIKDIVENELCTGCGLCISESKKGGMVWNEYGFLVPDVEADFNEDAIKVCPFNPKPHVEVEDEDKIGKMFLTESTHNNVNIGRYINTYVGHSSDFRASSSSGGVATYIFEQLLNKNIVDYLFIVKEADGTYEYQLFRNVNDIRKISKTKYIPVTLANLFKKIDEIEGRIALSGVACFIKAVRLKQYYNPALKQKIPFLVGIICGGLKSLFFTDYLAQKSGICGKYSKQDYRIKDKASSASDYSFGAFDEGSEFKQVKMRSVGDMWGTGLFKSNACDFCTDVTTELADISLGDAWLEPYNSDGMGTSVIVTRSRLANDLIAEGITTNTLKVDELELSRFLFSQLGSFNHRYKGLNYRLQSFRKKSTVEPKVRRRVLVDISFDLKIVQYLRCKLRKESLESWRKNKNLEGFESEIGKTKRLLKAATVFNHRLRRIKGLLFKKKI